MKLNGKQKRKIVLDGNYEMSNIPVEISPGRFLFSFSFRFISNGAIEHTLDDNDMGLFNIYYFNYSKFY